jgi:ABC-2 type transport system permease protein
MVATTAFTPSLEGKNYWIVKSLPIKSKDLYRGKMLFNMYLTIPFTLFATITISFSAKASLASTLLYMVLGIVLCAFSTTWGSVCGIKFMRLDWENEVEVIKQSAGVTLYLLPNMFVTMGLVVLVVVLGRIIGPNVITGIMIVIESVLAFICYIVAMKMVGKKGL